MIIVGILEGYSRSLSILDLSDMVDGSLQGAEYISRTKKAVFGRHQIYRHRKFILKHNSPENVLYLVGKSLGGRNTLITWNELGPLEYRATAILTIDVNWPIWRYDWTPNLNGITYPLMRIPTLGSNIYLQSIEPDQQAGCKVANIDNIAVNGKYWTHQSIVAGIETQREIHSLGKKIQKLHRSER